MMSFPVPPSHSRSSERGVVLILTLFVILITFALVTQMTIGTRVAFQSVTNQSRRVQMDAALLSVREEIVQMLSDDFVSGGAGSEEGMAGSGMAPPSEDGAAGTGDGEEGAEGEEDGASDSREDQWAEPRTLSIGNYEVVSWVEDENGKFNILTLLAEDEEFREESRQCLRRILDGMREESDEDLSGGDVEQIAEQIEEWLSGRNRDEEYPRPIRWSSHPEQEYAIPLVLEELLVLPAVTSEIFYDRIDVETEQVYPGLQSVLTVWTSLGDKSSPKPGAEDDPAMMAEAGGGDGTAGSGGGGQAGSTTTTAGSDGEGQDVDVTGSLGDAAGGPDGGATAAGGDAGVGTLINLNTAHPAVLLGLLPQDEMPRYVIEALLLYRNEIDEELLAEQEDQTYEEMELEEAFYGEEQRLPRRFFSSVDDLEEVDEFANLSNLVGRERFLKMVDVRSDVFTIHMVARQRPEDWEPESRFEEPPGATLRFRCVVWRRAGEGEGGEMVYLIPWEEIPFTRRPLADYPDRDEEFWGRQP